MLGSVMVSYCVVSLFNHLKMGGVVGPNVVIMGYIVMTCGEIVI